MAVLVGVDVGTSGTRAVAVDASGAVVAEATSRYEPDRPRPGWSEQRPEEWWQAAREVLAAVAAGAGDEILGLGLAGQMHGSVFLDSAGEVIRPASFGTTSGPRAIAPRSRSGWAKSGCWSSPATLR